MKCIDYIVRDSSDDIKNGTFMCSQENKYREQLFKKYEPIIEVDPKLDRTLVSFQANKKESFYRWFKYKEGFSKKLVKYFLMKYHPAEGHLFDPFAGVGSALFAAREMGWDTTGIELLPVGVFAFNTRINAEVIDKELFKNEIEKFKNTFSITEENVKTYIDHISITKGAFPKDTEIYLNSYMSYCSRIKNKSIQHIFSFAAFSILEEISFTRKDGQYLRWDYRANRSNGKSKFNKGHIYPFLESIEKKLLQILNDLQIGNGNDLFSEIENKEQTLKDAKLLQGSSLEIMPTLNDNQFDYIMTSPPYCNRYDYTRTYALELVFLGKDYEAVKKLRQEMLSCTVENKVKVENIKEFYSKINKSDIYEEVISCYNTNLAMTEVNEILSKLNKEKLLNNNNIPRMVKNYFLEMAFIIREMYRLLKPGGYCVMVNDNVRYGGQQIPVDLILSDFANSFGFEIIKIWTLPNGKGNSSQQMGDHGREELRKCVYVWRK